MKSFGNFGTGNSLFVTQGTSQFLCASLFFPIHGLAVVVKKESSTPAKPFMGKNSDLHRNWDVPFVTHREFQNSSTRGFAARGGIFPSQNRQMTSLSQCSPVCSIKNFSYYKLVNIGQCSPVCPVEFTTYRSSHRV